jgi:hypothetical protein
VASDPSLFRFETVLECGLISTPLQFLSDQSTVSLLGYLLFAFPEACEWVASKRVLDVLMALIQTGPPLLHSLVAFVFLGIVNSDVDELSDLAISAFLDTARVWSVDSSCFERQFNSISFVHESLVFLGQKGTFEEFRSRFPEFGPIMFGLLNSPESSIVELALENLKDWLVWTDDLSFVPSFEFMTQFWRPHTSDQVMTAFLQFLVGVTIRGNTADILDYVDWECLIGLEKSCTVWVVELLHQLTLLGPPAIELMIRHGVFELFESLFDGHEFAVAVVVAGAVKNILFLADQTQLHLLLGHNLAISLFRFIRDFDHKMSVTLLRVMTWAFEKLDPVVSVRSILLKWEEEGVGEVLDGLADENDPKLGEAAELLLGCVGRILEN